MILNFEQIKAMTVGAEKVTYDGEYYKFFRFSDKEDAAAPDMLMKYTAGVWIECKTDATALKLKVRVSDPVSVRTYFSFDIFKNSTLVGTLQNLPEESRVGNYTIIPCALGEFEGEISLPDGDGEVKILLPHSLIGEIQKIELIGATYAEPILRDKLYIAIGDSITQGYDALHPSSTYTYKIADMLSARCINKAIAGAIFNPRLLAAAEEHNPDYVSVAYGTNDWSMLQRDVFIKNATEFFDILIEKYPNAQISVISPVWRGDSCVITAMGEFPIASAILQDICEKHPRLKFIEGLDLIPHAPEMYGDLILHPSDEGFAHYFEGLEKQIFDVK